MRDWSWRKPRAIKQLKTHYSLAGLFNFQISHYNVTMDFILEQINSHLSEKGEAYLRVKVRPAAAKTAVRGSLDTEDGQTIKIDVAAQAERGKANEELIRYLAREFAVSKDRIKIISGAGEKLKLVKVTSNKKQ